MDEFPNTVNLLGAHVSAQGGVHTAPARARAIGATALQLFTKTPNQWREPVIATPICEAFRENMKAAGVQVAVAHDSYLINLASPDSTLSRRSVKSFTAELRRCESLGLTYLVSHPGNYMDQRERGLARNAARYAECLAAVPGPVMVLLETTAGTGTALGSAFEELAALRQSIPEPERSRVGFCADTCHLYSAGYDLARDFDGVWDAWDRIIGLAHLRCLHLNDSRTPFHSGR
ncbi:MAG TPA: deoxyribonuclease IV, partial [Gemmatimonadales bacterium]|nr:deoxyribonuclease IV [Gemmatimonadales bacterium]